MYLFAGHVTKNFTIAVSVAALSGSILGYILIQSYAANIISHITAVSVSSPPFHNLEGLLKQDYKITILRGAYADRQIKVIVSLRSLFQTFEFKTNHIY